MFDNLDPVPIGFIFFFIFVGVGFKLFVPSVTVDTTSVIARVYTQLTGMLVLGSFFVFILLWTKWSPWLLGPAGLLTSLGAGRFVMLTAEYFDKPDNLLDFLGRLAAAFKAGWGVFSAAKNDTTEP